LLPGCRPPCTWRRPRQVSEREEIEKERRGRKKREREREREKGESATSVAVMEERLFPPLSPTSSFPLFLPS
jgi:hypothetical protein